MRRVVRFGFLLISVFVLMSLTDSAFAIRNGQLDVDGYPNVCLIVFYVDIDPGPGEDYWPLWRTTGVLISETVVLTAGHGTDGTEKAMVWFDSEIADPGYPWWSNQDGRSGTPYTHPFFCIGCGPGLPGFDYHDVGVVVLDETVSGITPANLPTAGLVDELPMNSGVEIVGYGVQWQEMGIPDPYTDPPYVPPPRAAWRWNGERHYSEANLIMSNFVHSSEFLRLTANPAQGKGGTTFGDSGGPVIHENTVLGVNSYVTNVNCQGVTYSNRIDIQEILDWISLFLP